MQIVLSTAIVVALIWCAAAAPLRVQNMNRNVVVAGNLTVKGDIHGHFPTKRWVEHDGPVYTDGIVGNEDYNPCVLYIPDVSPPYRMWVNSGEGQIATLDSPDGEEWGNYRLTDLVSAHHIVVLYDVDAFGGGGEYAYKAWYWTGVASHGDPLTTMYAESVDGDVWVNVETITQAPDAMLNDGLVADNAQQILQLLQRDSGNNAGVARSLNLGGGGGGGAGDDPAGLQPTDKAKGLFYAMYGPAAVLYNKAPTSTPGKPLSYAYAMYYDIASEGTGPGSSIEATGLAYSDDGKMWRRHGKVPVLIPGGIGAAAPATGASYAWDAGYAMTATVVRDKTGMVHMFYTGANPNDPTGVPNAQGIGHATSTDDGNRWVPDPQNPIFHVGDGVAWRAGRTWAPAVLYDTFGVADCEPKWVMWFSGGGDTGTGINQGVGKAALLTV